MDYKNTPEGRAVQSKYGRILHASRPEPPHNHPRMPMSNRAKIFSPFAALRGYEDEIASEGRDHLKGNRIELSEEGKEVLNQKISQLWKSQEITIKYFTDGCMVHIFNPQLILIGGGVSAQQKLLIDPIAVKVKAAVMPAFAEGLEIRAAQLHNDAGMVGAVYYFRQTMEKE